MTKKTTYNVDLTVEEVASGAAASPPKKESKDSSKQSSPSKSVASPSQPPEKGGTPKGDEAAVAGKEDKKKKDKKKNKKKDKSSSSDSSSSSSSDSDSDGGKQTKGMKRALEAWRYPFYSPSASYRQLDVISGSHQYTVSGFSLARSMGCGTRLCSDFFEVGGQMFRLEIYPAGFTADTRKHVSVFLTTPGSINPNHVLYEVAILDQSGKDRHIVSSRDSSGERSGPMLSYCRGIVAAIPRLAKGKHLEEKAKRYLPNDMLVLRATVQMLRGWSSAPVVHHHMSSTVGYGAPALTLPGSVSRGSSGVPGVMQAGLAPSLMLQPAASYMGPHSPMLGSSYSPADSAAHMAVPGSYGMHAAQPVLLATGSPVHQRVPISPVMAAAPGSPGYMWCYPG